MIHLIRTLLYRKKIFWTGIMTVVILGLAVIGIQYFRQGQELILNVGPDRNLIIICIDALRADRLSCYGYDRQTSPRIDELADHGILFENAFSNSSFTQESVSAFFSGRLPSRSGSYGWRAQPHHKSAGLARLFSIAGFRTALMTTAPTLKPQSFSKGFDEIRFCLLSDIKDQWKYIDAVKWVIPENRPQALTVNIHQLENDTNLHLDPWGPIVHEELYHLADDPLEKHNRITECPEKRDELRIILEQYCLLCRKQSTMPTSIPSPNDSLTPDEVKALKTLGYFKQKNFS
ncbi:MAG: sulfatase-like hydrolase/transferase [Candidatus Delongbacteria bacterium]|nr:sulfatase-like hydrolase/transferase [Candidatus Delongbacteria bacterium]